MKALRGVEQSHTNGPGIVLERFVWKVCVLLQILSVGKKTKDISLVF